MGVEYSPHSASSLTSVLFMELYIPAQDISIFKEGTAPSDALQLVAENGDLSGLMVSRDI